MVLRIFYFIDIGKEIDDTDGHHDDGTCLADSIAGKAHQQREDSTSEESHDHQTAHFVLLVGHRGQRLCKADREDVGVAVADKGDSGIEHPLLGANEEPAHREGHHADADDEEGAVRQYTEEEGARQTANRTEDEVQAGGKGCLVKRHAKAFHQDLRCCGVCTYVDTHVTHDAKEGEQYNRGAK